MGEEERGHEPECNELKEKDPGKRSREKVPNLLIFIRPINKKRHIQLLVFF